MADFQAVHERLKAILAPHRDELVVTSDGPGGMLLEFQQHKGKPWGFAAGIRVGKRYVSYYLWGVYGDPALLAGMSPELRRRMQGKSCFNFTAIDEPLFAELAALTEKSIAAQPDLIDTWLAARPKR